MNATQALVGDDGPFQDLWRRHLGVSSMTCDEPVVDFGSEQVAILVLGGRAPCQGVQVLDVEGAEGSVRVEFVETMPAAGSVCIFENGTTPFHFVAVSRNAIGATFTEIYRTLAKGQDTHLPARQSVFETQEAWRTLWTEHKGNASAEPPAVDFETERVAVVAIGMRPNGCYGVWISDVDRLAEGAMTILEVKETGPREGFLCSQVIVEPYHFIAIPKDGTTVSFSG